jgi:hypothetical protein
MNKPILIVNENLLIPIRATESRIGEIKKEICSTNNPVIQNGLFLMAVSFIESMQKEVLTYYLKYDPQRIPNKKSIEITKNILIENEDFRMIESLVSEYIDKMPYWQFMKIFYETLKIQKPDNLQAIEAIKKRRNELTHDNMQVDFKQKRVTQKYIDSDYLSSSLNEYENYLNDLKLKISKRYGKFTRIKALNNLWHYTFRTPLCAKFEDYWHIDLQSDSIAGYKIPEYENSLSHSEKFMLGIWRSQVSSCKVDFINMASLGQHVQSCLYMFLKLSNDIFMY